MYKYLLFGLLIGINPLLSAQISVKTERPNARYEAGETVTFKVTGAASGAISYQIKHTSIDTLALLASGTAQIVNGQATITYPTIEPTFLTCQVTQDTNVVHAGAGVSIERLQPLEEEPADFDAFWTAQKAAVRAVPMDVNLTYVRTSAYSNVFSFDIAIIEGKRAYGYLVVPISVVGSYPAILLMPSFGSGANIVTDDVAMAERAGVLSVFLSQHNNPPNISSSQSNYLTDGIQTPQSFYLKYVLLGAVKTIDYLQTRPDFNGQVGAMGTSQGGGLSALIAGIDNRVSILTASYPSFCHQAAAKYSKPSAFPYTYITAQSATGINRSVALSTIKYYDPVYALRRFKGVSYNATSFKDFVCPPEAVYTALNQLNGQKINVVLFNKTHPQGPDEFFDSDLNNSIYALFRRHFSACRRAPWPYNPPTLGYVTSAGKDTTLVGNRLNLTGFVGVNDTAAMSFPVKWEKIDGNGTVVFSDSTSRNTTATFSRSGVYRLRFYGYDFSTVNNNKYYVLSNDIVVTVKASIPSELTGFHYRIQDKNDELTWTATHESNNQGFDIERSQDANRWQRLDKDNGIQLFPNPVGDILTIRMDNTTPSDIKIYDVLGRIQLSINTTTNDTNLTINHLAKGTYFIEIKNGPSVTIKKFIKS